MDIILIECFTFLSGDAYTFRITTKRKPFQNGKEIGRDKRAKLSDFDEISTEGKNHTHRDK